MAKIINIKTVRQKRVLSPAQKGAATRKRRRLNRYLAPVGYEQNEFSWKSLRFHHYGTNAVVTFQSDPLLHAQLCLMEADRLRGFRRCFIPESDECNYIAVVLRHIPDLAQVDFRGVDRYAFRKMNEAER